MRLRPLLLAAALAAIGCARDVTPRERLDVVSTLSASDSGYLRAFAPRPLSFPADHGPHPGYRTEWWYFTGNLTAPDGRAFGFELTFFRSALAASRPARALAWAAEDAFMAHFAVTDVARDSFSAHERFARGAQGLAGAQANPLRVWVEDWSVSALPAGAAGQVPTTPGTPPLRLRATQGEVSLDLVLGSLKPPVLEGERGLSRKGPEPGNASYYYSLTRMPARGTLRTVEGTFRVNGLAWMDREWGTSSLSSGEVGWDWFALQLSDGAELMYYRLRRKEGESPYSAGSWIAPDGSVSTLGSGDVRVRATGEWRSPASGVTYPLGWVVEVPSRRLSLRVRPRALDQELDLAFLYWEGAVTARGVAPEGEITAVGYVELTGYGSGS